MKQPRRLRAAIAALMIGTASSAFALNTATITASALSPIASNTGSSGSATGSFAPPSAARYGHR